MGNNQKAAINKLVFYPLLLLLLATVVISQVNNDWFIEKITAANACFR